MNKQIDVYAEDGRLMTPTFPKRAKQLVKTGRAKWVGDDSICMFADDKKEEDILDGNNKQEKSEIIETVAHEVTDDKIYAMAKKRVKEREALLIHVAAYISVVIFARLVINNAFVYIAGGWGIGLACHVASYFFSATPDAVQKEYIKMKNKYYS